MYAARASPVNTPHASAALYLLQARAPDLLEEPNLDGKEGLSSLREGEREGWRGLGKGLWGSGAVLGRLT